ncbi:adenylate/guanylate cyclase domain-containing protein [Mesorhizobium sp. VK23B]|uniref:Adenylate/guanylate cyclase domain-containing protein n=1 Tax=Mesorhizobium dulcispinae TaxID=3072316 RepID=A0ABU4XM18_9HYPH|nr:MULTISPECIES: adenylate/guanylate cyclase domain-containing protein [unclassified Mesorhizobium]MDX8468271.1 adenylate/guanylate cyclase domain-containing protein [Mesorhizobium sp. VK23B]MDX8474609.1 adenylate/guanylate cyclase domain-containing protein [Mesorhizobium sp. VK23A]
MAEERVQRRLAAILVADVVGYSRLMEADEQGTLKILKARRRDILAPLITRYRGRLVKIMGDGVLVEFASAVDAVQCAVDLQYGTAEANESLPDSRRVILRIGINLGDIIVDGSDLYGDGVNVAARLEALGEPGDICVSGNVYDQVKRKVETGFDDLGQKSLKNIAEPVRVYRVRHAAIAERKGEPGPLPLPSEPSIAVLPFTNMSGDAEQDVFTDGLTEDLITDLSRNASLFVIARHSTFAYKGKSIDIRLIARDLGVRYLLEGSARRAAGRVRINVQLIDAITGNHLWADRFDRDLEDIFAVQDEVTAKIVEALIGRLAKQPPRNRPNSLEAYDLCVRGRALIGISPAASRESRLLLQRAITLDPDYAEAHRLLAFHLWQAWAQWGEPEVPNRLVAVATAEKAVKLDPNDAGCRFVLGHLLAYERRWSASDAEFAAALEIDPNYADAWADLSDFSVLSGKPATAIEQVQKALRLNPHPPKWYYWDLGFAQYAACQYELAVVTLRNEATYQTISRRLLAASLAQLGRTDEARQEGALFMASNPHFTISHWVASQPFRDQATCDHFVDGYRKAGLPD